MTKYIFNLCLGFYENVTRRNIHLLNLMTKRKRLKMHIKASRFEPITQRKKFVNDTQYLTDFSTTWFSVCISSITKYIQKNIYYKKKYINYQTA